MRDTASPPMLKEHWIGYFLKHFWLRQRITFYQAKERDLKQTWHISTLNKDFSRGATVTDLLHPGRWTHWVQRSPGITTVQHQHPPHVVSARGGQAAGRQAGRQDAQDSLEASHEHSLLHPALEASSSWLHFCLFLKKSIHSVSLLFPHPILAVWVPSIVMW